MHGVRSDTNQDPMGEVVLAGRQASCRYAKSATDGTEQPLDCPVSSPKARLSCFKLWYS